MEAKLESLLSVGAILPERRVLLVDDDSFFRRVLVGGFRYAGIEVLEAASAEQAFKLLLGQLRVDAILIGYYLPGMSAKALIDWIRANESYADIPIAVITAAELDDRIRAELEALRAVDLISKSLPLDDMAECVCALTDFVR